MYFHASVDDAITTNLYVWASFSTGTFHSPCLFRFVHFFCHIGKSPFCFSYRTIASETNTRINTYSQWKCNDLAVVSIAAWKEQGSEFFDLAVPLGSVLS
jgi:hypothetical protein